MAEIDEDEIDLDDAEEEIPSEVKPLSKATALQARLRQLKTKMNQARQLNQIAVREEGEQMVVGKSHRNTKPSMDSIPSANSKAVLLAKDHGIDPEVLLQPAAESLARAQRQAEKDELNQYDIKDYHNPEGQFRNYQRNVQSLPRETTDSPAHRVAMELHRRIDKRQRKERKRKEGELRQGEEEGSSGINLRNQRFNAKIQRTLGDHTKDIRHNLERGTAL